MRWAEDLTICVLALLVIAPSACRSSRSDVVGGPSADAGVDAPLERSAGGALDASADSAWPELDASPALVWPALDGERHCASVRTIAGYIDAVPAWRRDAGYRRTLDRDGGRVGMSGPGDDVVERALADDPLGELRACGKEIPSGFTSCEYAASAQPSLNWFVRYSCTVGPPPDEDAASARFRELAAVWRRCFASSGLDEVRYPRDSKLLTFREPPRPGKQRSCDLSAIGTFVRMTCSVGENN